MLGRKPPSRCSTRLGWGVLWLVILMMLVWGISPTGSLGASPVSTPGTASSPLAAPRASPTPSSHLLAPNPSGSQGLPGADPAGPTVSPETPSEISQVRSTLSRIPQQVTGPTIGHPAAQSSNTSATALPSSNGPTASSSGNVKFLSGIFQGYVNSSGGQGSGLSGVTVQAYSNGGGGTGPCPASICSPAASNATGFFSVVCPVGVDYALFTTAWYAQNLTYQTCVYNETVYVGTTYLLPDGIVTGQVLADDPAQTPLAGVSVTGSTRDSVLTSVPIVTTASNGSFTVPVPPDAASMLTFSPGPNFESNFTDVFAAGGQTVNIGVVYMEPMVAVQAQFYDAITGAAIQGAGNSPLTLTVCSLLSGACGTQGPPTEGGNVVEALGPPGYDYVLAEAPGYLLNKTDIGFASATPGTTYCVPNNCRINLIPQGAVSVTVGLSAVTTYSLGLWYASVTSLDGEEITIPVLNTNTYTYNTTVTTTLTGGCLGVGATTALPAFPLRDEVRISPDTSGVCSFNPTWPIPGDAPVYANETWANVTPDEVTSVGQVNLIVGTYVFGTIGVTGGDGTLPSVFSVTTTSRESSTVSSYPYTKTRFNKTSSPFECAPEPNYHYTFCVPAPPGPDSISLSALGYPSNGTWFSVPWAGFNASTEPLLLWNATNDHTSMINLTAMASVVGSVTVVGGSEPIPFAALEICPASSHAAVTQCADGVANSTGVFNVSAVPTGWVTITASAGGYSPNSIWAYVQSVNTSVGDLPLTPLALVEGQVVATNGSGLIDVSISYCTIASWSHGGACANELGSGLTTSNGRYEGFIPGGWLPGATYTILAQSSGYLSDWTLLNATSNSTVQAPTLVLPQVGSSGNGSGPSPVARAPSTPRPPGPAAGPTGSWVTGQLVDATTGAGIETSAIQACTASNLTCALFTPGSNSGGFFNGSVASGTYNLTLSPTGYYPTTILLAANTGNSLNLGRIPLTPLGWVSGRTYINPWPTIKVYNPSTGANVSILMGAPSTAQVCTASLSFCSTADPVDSAGLFMVQTISGPYLALTVTPTYQGGSSSAPGGFVRNSTQFNSTGVRTNVTTPIPLDIFMIYMVTAYNNDSLNATTHEFTLPAIWTSVSLASHAGSGRNGQASGQTNGAGQLALFMAAGGAQTLTLSVGNPQMYYPITLHNPTALNLGQPNLTYTFPSANLTAFGWAVATIINSVTGLPALGVGMSSSFTTATGLVVSTSGSANGGGYVNISAPVGKTVRFSIGGTADYNNTTYVAAVQSGITTYINSTNASGAIGIVPWGWVRSSELNYSVPGDYVGTIVDPVHFAAVPDAGITVQSSDPALGSTTASPGNGLGEFMVDAPVGPADYLQVSAEGYMTNTTARFAVLPGRMTVFPTINLTGEGVLAGKVIGLPSGLPIAGATVTICPANSTFSPECVSVTTNLSGIYWAAAPPGRVAVTVTALNYIGNYSEDVTVHSDVYTEAPTYEMQEYGLVTGTVIGLPIGLALAHASVSLCSPIGTPTGPCSFQYDTTPNGSFSLSVPAAQYVVVVSYPYYNSTYLPISLRPGEVLALGSLFAQEYGILLGTVRNSVTGSPIANAIVSGCPVLLWMSCDAPVRTSASGLFRLSASSGTVYLSVAAQGYETGFATHRVTSGATHPIPSIQLLPVNAEVSYPVSGLVVGFNGTVASGLPGVTVAFKVGPVTAYSTTTDSLGRYSLQVLAGSYSVSYSLPGYLTVSENLSVTSPVRDLNATLTPFLYLLAGETIDGLTAAPLSNVSIVAASALGPATTSGLGGQWRLSLPNGTYRFTATASNQSPHYAPSVFQVVISGASVSRTVRLVPPSGTLTLQLRSAANGGSPLPNGSILVYGTALDGASLSYSARTDSLGELQLSLYYGQYTVVAGASGYYSLSQALMVGASSPALNLTLAPVPAPVGSGSGVWIAAALGLSAAGIGVLGVLVWGRRS